MTSKIVVNNIEPDAGISSVTVNGGLTVTGLLKYEDVKNVDSIGVITARSGIDAPSNLLLKTAGSEKLRIESGGRVFIGETSVAGSTQKLVIGNGGAENFEFSPAMTSNNLNGGLIEYLHRGDGNTRPDLNLYTGGAGNIKLYTNGNERLRVGTSGQIGIGGANYGTSGQVLTSQGSGSAVQWATPSGVIQTVYQIKGAFETEATNSNSSSTPESIIDGCQSQIQVMNASSKIMVTYAGFTFYSKRYGPSTAYIDIAFADSSSSGVNFASSDYSALGTDGVGAHRKPKSNTSSDWYRGESGPGCVRVLHTHGKAVGRYLYYTIRARQTYSSSNSPGYIFNGGSGYFTVTLQEII